MDALVSLDTRVSWYSARVDAKAAAEKVSDVVLNLRHKVRRCLHIRELSYALHLVGVDDVPDRKRCYVFRRYRSDSQSGHWHICVILALMSLGTSGIRRVHKEVVAIAGVFLCCLDNAAAIDVQIYGEFPNCPPHR